MQAVIYIVEHSKIRVNIKDADGKTGLYLLLGLDNIDPKVKSSLENHRALPGTDVLSIEFLEWIENSRNAIMVVASLIATMAFQEGISPPGGVCASFKWGLQLEASAVQQKTDGGGTILHLCVKYNQLKALEMLINAIEDPEFVNAKNEDGMTILHLAYNSRPKACPE
ncbi:hypothetical protein ACH5RR_039919 [Cinchona calisaya]|uniref:PGG domain-containing protein n=1 Tax=Cinchona calisaya TaxID=153742 RepID=A0ABD2XZQ0_9GENT